MLCRVVGIRRVDMTGDNGQPVRGYSVFMEHDEDGVTGVMAEKTFVADDWIHGHLDGWIPNPGDDCECSFNRRGKIVIDSPAV